MDRRLDVGVETSRQDGLGNVFGHLGDGAASLGRRAEAALMSEALFPCALPSF